MSNYESRECRYETFTIDRREQYFVKSAKFRNAANDFAARYTRGETYQKKLAESMRPPQPEEPAAPEGGDGKVLDFPQQKARYGR